MTEQKKDSITQSTTSPPVSDTQPKKFGVSGLEARLRAAAVKAAKDVPEIKPNRISLQLDVSGSMAGRSGIAHVSKLDLMKDAVQGFVQSCSSNDTAVSMTTFPRDTEHEVPLTCQYGGIIIESQQLRTLGNTPMAETMEHVAKTQSITRAIIVSDGQPDRDPTDENYRAAAIQPYLDLQIPIDCVHIGEEDAGEELLERIAKMTGGKYIKFTDVGAFAQNFKFLTPTYRAMLNAPGADKMIGAKEVK